ncbi:MULTISPECIES: hypothetical protein [Streptomyces]|uniref:Uncharacterized protein n=1 Tax=Streptomyces dengpaensis TaxID=2049881 RepID=A0ABM6SV58_9ACTN|nr:MULTISPECIES: hypothetical protein [Streptomyces]AVH58406.1 hypothetical protein C4B68_24500 [Streptomyces dengpaensis]PIB06080.1 hypothetical protein B1C81_26220 [Streptomyces sp. HG99]
MSPTPKQARSYHRKARTVDTTKNVTAYRVEASWNTRPNAPVVIKTADKRRAYSKAREFANQAAYVIVQEHQGWDRWRTLDEFDGPALDAERRRAERAAVEDARRAAEEAEQRLAAAEQRDAEQAALARLMSRPPVAREQSGRREARHVTGAQR